MRVLDASPRSPRVRAIEREIRRSEFVHRLLTRARDPFVPGKFGGIYRDWQGIHWALATLSDIGYPGADPGLSPLLDRALAMWTQPWLDRTVKVTSGGSRATLEGVTILRGRYRRCASQQGNALLYTSRLGAPDERADHLADLLTKWQWPDGGWNCARSPSAHVSSFMETLTPLRGLAAYAHRTGSKAALRTAERAAEVFLERRLFRRRTTGSVIRSGFLQLHYPLYWHYDVLGGLKGMAEVGRIADPRCREALDWLEGRELPSGGWPADARFFRVSDRYEAGAEYVNWGTPTRTHPNDWVTTDALFVLGAAGRLND
ncbi:MAG: hypothetical protein WA691_04770 [Thermoplasmata archaeon]